MRRRESKFSTFQNKKKRFRQSQKNRLYREKIPYNQNERILRTFLIVGRKLQGGFSPQPEKMRRRESKFSTFQNKKKRFRQSQKIAYIGRKSSLQSVRSQNTIVLIVAGTLKCHIFISRKDEDMSETEMDTSEQDE